MSTLKPKNENSSSNLLWKLNDQKANKEGHHAKVYWVKTQKKAEDGSNHRSQWKFSHSYQGGWENNIKSGFGIQLYENGDKYEGEWSNNFRNGFGTYWVKNEKKKLVRSYTGQYLNDQKHGKGTMFFDDGRRYDGHWEANNVTGFGRMIYTNGDVYVGHWKQNMRHGYGVFTKINGDYYEGNWLLDKREGYGTHLFASTGKIIIGEWTDDMPKTSVLYKLTEEEKETEKDNGPTKDGLLKSQIMKKRVHPENNELSIKFNNLLLPALQLENPIDVLEGALNDVRLNRLGFRVSNTPVEMLVGQIELQEMAEEWRKLMEQETTAPLDRLEPILSFDSAEQRAAALAQLEVDPSQVYFEDFVRLTVFRDSAAEMGGRLPNCSPR